MSWADLGSGVITNLVTDLIASAIVAVYLSITVRTKGIFSFLSAQINGFSSGARGISYLWSDFPLIAARTFLICASLIIVLGLIFMTYIAAIWFLGAVHIGYLSTFPESGVAFTIVERTILAVAIAAIGCSFIFVEEKPRQARSASDALRSLGSYLPAIWKKFIGFILALIIAYFVVRYVVETYGPYVHFHFRDFTLWALRILVVLAVFLSLILGKIVYFIAAESFLGTVAELIKGLVVLIGTIVFLILAGAVVAHFFPNYFGIRDPFR